MTANMDIDTLLRRMTADEIALAIVAANEINPEIGREFMRLMGAESMEEEGDR